MQLARGLSLRLRMICVRAVFEDDGAVTDRKANMVVIRRSCLRTRKSMLWLDNERGAFDTRLDGEGTSDEFCNTIRLSGRPFG